MKLTPEQLEMIYALRRYKEAKDPKELKSRVRKEDKESLETIFKGLKKSGFLTRYQIASNIFYSERPHNYGDEEKLGSYKRREKENLSQNLDNRLKPINKFLISKWVRIPTRGGKKAKVKVWKFNDDPGVFEELLENLGKEEFEERLLRKLEKVLPELAKEGVKGLEKSDNDIRVLALFNGILPNDFSSEDAKKFRYLNYYGKRIKNINFAIENLGFVLNRLNSEKNVLEELTCIIKTKNLDLNDHPLLGHRGSLSLIGKASKREGDVKEWSRLAKIKKKQEEAKELAKNK